MTRARRTPSDLTATLLGSSLPSERHRVQLATFDAWRAAPKSTKRSSAQFGPCEVCHGHCSETFIRATTDSRYLMGHEGCLAAATTESAS